MEAGSSIEHIIPESLGNLELTLPAGVVCLTCNNYFARKIEGPLLTCDAFVEARFDHALANKRGRVPAVRWTAFPSGMSLEVGRDSVGRTHLTVVGHNAERWQTVLEQGNQFTAVRPIPARPPSRLMARFIGKIALEALAHRVLNVRGGLDEILNKTELDELRQFVRYNEPPGEWPVHERELYDPADTAADDAGGAIVIHEFTFLYTPQRELYFVIALFGREYALNLGGPEIDGFIAWLAANDDLSPLYLDDIHSDTRYVG